MHSFLVFLLIFSQSSSSSPASHSIPSSTPSSSSSLPLPLSPSSSSLDLSSPSPAANFFLHYREFWYSCHSNLSLYGFKFPKPPLLFFYLPSLVDYVPVDDLQDCFRIGYSQASCGPFPDIASLSRLGQFLRYLIEDPSFIKTLVNTRYTEILISTALPSRLLSLWLLWFNQKRDMHTISKCSKCSGIRSKTQSGLATVISPSLLFPLFVPVYPEDFLSPLRASVAHKRPRQSEWKEKDETELSAVLESSALPYEVDDERAILPSAIWHAASAVSPSLEPFVCFSVTPPPTTSLVAPTAASLVAFSDFPSSSSSPASTSFISLSPQFPPTSLPSSPFVPPSPSPDPCFAASFISSSYVCSDSMPSSLTAAPDLSLAFFTGL